MNKSMNKKNGFSLVELVVGIIVLAIAMLGMNTMLVSQSKDALEPLYRLRASQLGQSIIEDILSRAYDQNSDFNGGFYRCGEIWGDDLLWYDGTNWQVGGPAVAVDCTLVANYGPDSGESGRPDFNDVDDFIEENFISLVNYGDPLAKPYPSQYNNYYVKIAVKPYSTMKEIKVTIKTPSNEQILFSALKGNY